MKTSRVLLIDDDDLFGNAVTDFLLPSGVDVRVAKSRREALSHDLESYGVVIADRTLPDGEGCALLGEMKWRNRRPHLVLVSADPTYANACECAEFDARLEKPIDLGHLKEWILRVLQPSLPARLDAAAVRLAASNLPLLITGETGTGKTRLARDIHVNSPRSRGPFVSLDCAALSESVIESELFGSTRGAFTDARDRQGLFEAADGGTLFLDEIGELPLTSQTKLLTVLEEGCVRRVGESRRRAVDVRVIAATHVDLESAVNDRRFRRDLFHRLDVGRIHIEPLRLRFHDLEQIVADVLREIGAPTTARLGAGELERLRLNPFAGNFRELRNALQRSLVLDEVGDLRPTFHLRSSRPGVAPRLPDIAPASLVSPTRSRLGKASPPHEVESDDWSLEAAERRHIEWVLEQCAGNRARAARRLAISVATLRRKLRATDASDVDGSISTDEDRYDPVGRSN